MCADTMKPVFEGGKTESCGRNSTSVCQVYSVTRITDEGGAEFLMAWVLDWNKRERGGRRTGAALQFVRVN